MIERISAAVDRNEAFLRGVIARSPELSHTAADQTFFRFSLAADRLSGHADVLNVIAPAICIAEVPTEEGAPVELVGSLRSRNVHEDGRYRLILTVFAGAVRTPADPEHCNRVQLSGTVCKQPVHRVTPLGREVCDVMLAVRRRYGRADFLPLIAWGRNAAIAGNLQIGDRILCDGRFQSREYVKAGENGDEVRTAYEVSLSSLRKWSE